MNFALIIGRKGSTGFPGKNTLPILGRPLCAYPILAAKNSWYASEVYFSTDDEKLMDIARDLEVEIIETIRAMHQDSFGRGCFCPRLSSHQ